ncbi:MAG: geranylgeranylglyceryl/heptaprenylglyceryl phosphate synthase [Bacteroidia bacterium]|nr:geranylgeranylglyceryl/heptaprenylglyceryl phosphate synthase [Bacteroidia bacterium]MDW8016059.1 geranylgeranylglyceryl/heptaprenylglyceryl phosphate synthase [Bacteroidia bacterium]
MKVLEAWEKAQAGVLWLIDPDQLPLEKYKAAAEAYLEAGGRWALIGGSFLVRGSLPEWCAEARRQVPLSLILFPGSPLHLSPDVEAILFLFLASGRNPYYLIGAHIEAVPFLQRWKGEVIPTTYILIGQTIRTVHYITHTMPIPSDKPELVQATALAGWYLGQKVVYIDAGSGAPIPPSPEIVEAVRAAVPIPLLVGGGVRRPETAHRLLQAGATFVVIGTATEKAFFSKRAWEEYFSLCSV